MKNIILTICILIGFISPVAAESNNNEHRYILDVIQSLKNIIHKQENEKATRTVLNNIKGSKPLIENGLYKGQQIIQSGKLKGFIGIEYSSDKAKVAVYSTTPLKIHYATRHYRAFRKLLGTQYTEISHNHFDLSDHVIARIKKQARKVTIDVYRKK